MIHKSPSRNLPDSGYSPELEASAFVHPLAAVIGHVVIGKKIFVAPFSSVRGKKEPSDFR
jgi:carbonic anhydrase/acetyltransferase-like protein (isoleucine patch superfamily)